ncbi:MAG TPA: hypothetical protein VLK27_07430 [Chthoniobacterales bacterium]|nr:hypothetical protein [Chthoniobacterales bacterium]
MKIKSLIIVATLVGALQLSSGLMAQGQNEAGAGPRGHWQSRMANLSPDERQKLMAARQKAMQDPGVQAAHEKMKTAHKEFMTSMHAAMLKADPSIQPVLDKMPKGGHGGRGGEQDED